ncbi:hypothetical protein F4775DRAFT_588915 [Biscogniauxia sp. FL1348]|nr:hypothetical protein F4775DRAFT_588915 [Biscogniauxia sp. FL1348]
MFGLLSKVLTIALATQVAALPVENATVEKRAQNVLIGYRTVSSAQAQRYLLAGTLTDDGNQIGTQIGPGVYTTPNAGGWPGSANSWYCAIFAEDTGLNNVNKVKIPQSFGGKKLWFGGDAAIDEYIKSVVPSADPNKTMRISKIDGQEETLQMVIPPGLLNTNGGGLAISISCATDINDIPSAVVNYDSWTKVFGSP